MKRSTKVVALICTLCAMHAADTLAATRTWTGAVSNLWSDPGNWGGTAPLAGDSLVFPATATNMSNTNDLPAGTSFDSIAVNDAGYRLTGNPIVLANALTAAPSTAGSAQVSLPITFTGASAAVTLAGTGNVSQGVIVDGGVTVTGGSLTFDVRGLLSGITAGGSIGESGPAAVLAKTGDGTLALDAANTYTGSTTINQGTLRLGASHVIPDTSDVNILDSGTFDVNGMREVIGTLSGTSAASLALAGGTLTVTESRSTSFSGSITGTAESSLSVLGSSWLTLTGVNDAFLGAVSVNQTATLSLPAGASLANAVVLPGGGGGQLNGNGTVGRIVSSGIVAPGIRGPGRLTAASYSAPSGAFLVDIYGRSSAEYDQLVVLGDVSVGYGLGVNLVAGNFAPVIGEQFRIIDNLGPNPVSGIFAGVPEGFTFTAGGPYLLQITYRGGDGNDVVLTVLGIVPGQAAPPSITAAFADATIPLGGNTDLRFTIANDGTRGPAFLTGIAFTNTLAAGLVLVSPGDVRGSCGGGTITASGGGGTISLTGASLAVGKTCQFSVSVAGVTAGTKNNSVTVTSLQGGDGNTSNATLAVVAPPTVPIPVVPALQHWAIALLGMLLAISGVIVARVTSLRGFRN